MNSIIRVTSLLVAVSIFLFALSIGCVDKHHTKIDSYMLIGVWASNHESFDFKVTENSILYEADMKEHPYRIEDNVLIVDFEGDSMDTRRSTIIELSKDLLILQDPETKNMATFHRMAE